MLKAESLEAVHTHTHTDNLVNKKGITLVALVVTIVVLLILAGVSINLVLGQNGLITQTQRTKIITELSTYQEQLDLFLQAKSVESEEFYKESLMASKNGVFYNTKKDDSENSIKSIIKNISDEYLEKIEIVKGNLIINTQDKRIIKIAQEMNIEVNPYKMSNGELLSDNDNLSLVDENGTLTIPMNVTTIGTGAFSDVEGLKTIIIPGNVKTISADAFANNRTLETVIIKEGCEKIGESAFYNCANLKNVLLPDSITQIDSAAFYNSRKIEEIEIPANLEELKNMVFSVTGLTKVTFRGDKIKSIGRETFFGCKIESINITKDIENIDATAFDHCTNLTDIRIDKQNTNFKYENGMLITKEKDKVLFVSSKYYENATSFSIPEGIIDFTCNISKIYSIKKLIVPASTKTLNARNLPITISEVEIAQENENFQVAEECIYTKTEPITLVFCFSKATQIELKENVNTIAKFSFRGATNATKITFNDSTQKLENQIFGKEGKVEVILGKNVKSIDSMFALWKYDYEITIDAKNPYYVIEDNVLYNKQKDTLITVINLIKGKFTLESSVKTISGNAFYGQEHITEIDLANVEVLEGKIFSGCIGLKTIEIPKTIKTISTSALSGAKGTEKVIIHKKENSIAGSPFSSPFGLRAIKWVGEN